MRECRVNAGGKTPEGKRCRTGAISRGAKGVFEAVNVRLRNRRWGRKAVEEEEEEEEEM